MTLTDLLSTEDSKYWFIIFGPTEDLLLNNLLK